METNIVNLETIPGLNQFIVDQEDSTIELFLGQQIPELASNPDKLARTLYQLETEEKYFELRAAALKAAASRFYSWREFIKNNVKNYMNHHELKSVSGTYSKTSISHTRGRVVIDNEEVIPAKYKRVEQVFKIEKEMIRADIEQGIEVPGARLEVGFSLRTGIISESPKPRTNADSKKDDKQLENHKGE